MKCKVSNVECNICCRRGKCEVLSEYEMLLNEREMLFNNAADSSFKLIDANKTIAALKEEIVALKALKPEPAPADLAQSAEDIADG